MVRYLIRRSYTYLITMVLLLFLLFCLGHFLPTSHFTNLTGLKEPTLLQFELAKQAYQLDGPMILEFFAFMAQRLNGEFGVSMVSQRPIIDEILMFLPASIEMWLCAFLLAVTLGIPIGVVSSLTEHKWVKTLIGVIALGGYSVPIFWFGILVSLTVGDAFQLLPTSGRINLIYDMAPITGFYIIDALLYVDDLGWEPLQSVLVHLIVPTVTLAIYPFTLLVRVTHVSISDVVQHNYVKAAKSRGLHPLLILKRHILPNAALPIMRQTALMIGGFISYGIINEVIFSWPGLGSWLITGIEYRDYTVIQAGVYIFSFVIISLSILNDFLYYMMSPLNRKEIYDSY